MILKGSQRGSGADLAIHLMNGFDNERIEVAEVYGTVAGDLLGAFEEFEAIAAGTKAEKYLYSLSINPPKDLTREQYYEAIQEIEAGLGLTDQPRAVVFHVKNGRAHCHVVWSRIDVENMKAIHMAHDRRKLMDMACELAHKYDLDLPPGLKAWEAKQKFEKDQLESGLAEKAQSEQTGISPEQRRVEITAAYEQADNAKAFISALQQKGYVLAAGDRRGFVVVDRFENVHSLTRYVKGHKAKDIKAKLAPLTPADLPSVDQAKEIVRRRRQPQQKSQGEGEGGLSSEAQGAKEEALAKVEQRRRKAEAALAKAHAQRRSEVQAKEQELLIRQHAETLSLHAAQKAESGSMMYRIRSAVADLIGKTPGLRSVLGHIQKLTHLDPKERHQLERGALARRHQRERLDIARERRFLARIESREKRSLGKALRKATQQAWRQGAKAKQDFHAATRDQGQWRKKEFGDGDMSVEFNDAAEFVEGADRTGEEGDDLAPDGDQSPEKRSRSHRPRRGKGFGHRREDE